MLRALRPGGPVRRFTWACCSTTRANATRAFALKIARVKDSLLRELHAAVVNRATSLTRERALSRSSGKRGSHPTSGPPTHLDYSIRIRYRIAEQYSVPEAASGKAWSSRRPVIKRRDPPPDAATALRFSRGVSSVATSSR